MNNRTCNELFLLAVANKYSISFEELERSVFDEFIHDDPDPNGDYLHSTEHFDRFVKEHEIKEVNVGAVVLYLKGVRLAVSHQELVDDLYEMEDESEGQNAKINLARFVLYGMGLVLTGLSYLL